MGRVVAVALLSGALLAGGPAGDARAHGGSQVLSAVDGAYHVTVVASSTTTPDGPAEDLTTYLVRRDLGAPDLRARVRLLIEDGRGRRKVRAPLVGDGYEAVVPGEPNAWRDWSIEVHASGVAGTAVVATGLQSPDRSLPAWVWPATVGLMLAAAALVLRARRRVGRPAGPLSGAGRPPRGG